MEEAKEKTLDFKASDIEACRICLATDVKLYGLQDTHLGACMKSIGGFNKSYDGLPNYVCYECAPILIKCNKLIDKSITAQATLLDIFNKNGQILNKPLIQEHKKSEQNLQSSLDSYLLLNYFYIKYDDDSNTSDVIKIETDLNGKKNINLKNEIKEESSDEVSDSEILKMLKDLSKEEESEKDSDVEAIEVEVPVVEIVSDDEKIGDDFISLKSYKVKMDNRVKGLLAHYDDIPHYHKQKVRPIGVAKKGVKGKKKKKKKNIPTNEPPFAYVKNSFVKRYFNIHDRPARPNDKIFSCKFCPDTFNYVDDARDHNIIGCQKPQSSDGDTSFPNPGSESTATLNQPNVWKDWPAGST